MNNQNLNLIIAILLSVGIIFGWQYFFDRPRLQADIMEHASYNKTVASRNQASSDAILDRAEAIISSTRLKFANDNIAGSINLLGLRFDDLTLLKYTATTDKESPNVILLSPNKSKDAYFAEFGWSSSNKNIILPDQNTLWKADKDFLKDGDSVAFTWKNPQNILFKITISLDNHYMFEIKQEITNNSMDSVPIQSYGLIYKTYDPEQNRMSIVHEGGTGVFGEELKEFTYSEIKDKKKIANKLSSVNWFGMTDKYWLVTLIPDQSFNYNSNAGFFIKNSLERYQIDFISPSEVLSTGNSLVFTHRLFCGVKDIVVLDDYESNLNIKLFDRTVDFGWFYIITKPLLNILHFFYNIVGNFGVSIMIVTVLVKLLMFNMANKSYKSMKAMKALQPEIELIRNSCGDDKVKLNQEIMALYKAHGVSPFSGCLPIFIQIPVFFSLYKVLNVAIDMRHAPFFGWIRDLSVADPTNLFNLFGLLSIQLPSFLHIGIWPLLMAFTMFLQQRMSPPASDPVQAKMMKMMPVIFLFMFGNFPAGLLIYWTWNNILSILQQAYINRSNA